MGRPLQVARYAVAAAVVAAGEAFALYLMATASLSGNCFEGAGSNCDSSTGSSLASSVGTIVFVLAIVVMPLIVLATGIALGVDRSQALGWVRFGLLVVLLLPLYPVAGVAVGLLVNYADIGITAGVGVALAAVVAYLAAWSTLARVLRQGREPLGPEVSRPSAMG